MYYGKIIDNEIVVVMGTDDAPPRGYNGALFHNENGQGKTLREYITEENLKPIIYPSENQYPVTYYTFVENSDTINVTSTLTESAQEIINNQLINIRKSEIQKRLDALSQDIIQEAAGEIVPDINLRKEEFITLHNELRDLLGLPPRT